MSATIRRVRVEDYDAVEELATLLSGVSANRRAQFAVVLESPDRDLLVAEVEGAVVGYAELMTYQDLFHGVRAGELLGLVVLESHRGHGIGRALLEEIIRRARVRGVAELHISTEPGNLRAQRLYASLGARLVDVHMEVDLQEDA